MSISYETIVNQMINKLESAKANIHNKQDLLRHIYHVHGLCELIIEQNDKASPVENTVDESEIVQFIENKGNVTSYMEQDEEDSIFDF